MDRSIMNSELKDAFRQVTDVRLQRVADPTASWPSEDPAQTGGAVPDLASNGLRMNCSSNSERRTLPCRNASLELTIHNSIDPFFVNS